MAPSLHTWYSEVEVAQCLSQSHLGRVELQDSWVCGGWGLGLGCVGVRGLGELRVRNTSSLDKTDKVGALWDHPLVRRHISRTESESRHRHTPRHRHTAAGQTCREHASSTPCFLLSSHRLERRQRKCWNLPSLALDLDNLLGSQGGSRAAVFNPWVATPSENLSLSKCLHYN